MKERIFYYHKIKFEPIGNILGGWMHKNGCTTWDKAFEIKIDYKDFYKVARKHHASCDVYRINDSLDLYMLTGSNHFLRVYNLNNLKKCEEYERWYQ